MTKTVKILKYANAIVARFDTHFVGDKDNPFTGRRAKHRVYENTEVPGSYWHEVSFLSEFDEPEEGYTRFVSERVFFGKYRLVRERVAFLPETWNAIAFSVRELEKA